MLTDSLFKIEPNILEAPPGSSQTIHCKIRWNSWVNVWQLNLKIKFHLTYRCFFSNEMVEEQWYLHATIEGQAKRELLGTSLFTAIFMEPDILFDKSELTFRLDFGPDREDIQKQGKNLVINYVSSMKIFFFFLNFRYDCHNKSIRSQFNRTSYDWSTISCDR